MYTEEFGIYDVPMVNTITTKALYTIAAAQVRAGGKFSIVEKIDLIDRWNHQWIDEAVVAENAAKYYGLTKPLTYEIKTIGYSEGTGGVGEIYKDKITFDDGSVVADDKNKLVISNANWTKDIYVGVVVSSEYWFGVAKSEVFYIKLERTDK